MIENKYSGKEQVSGAFAVLGHALYFAVIMPIFLLVLSAFGYSLIQDFKLDIFLIAAFFAGIFLLITKICLAFSDVYIEGDKIVLKKLWGSKSKSASEYKRIDHAAILPYTFIIEFENGRRYYFRLKSTRVFEYILSNDPNKVLKELKFTELKKLS